MLEELKRTTCLCTPLAVVHAPICVRSPNFSFHFWATTLFLSPLSCCWWWSRVNLYLRLRYVEDRYTRFYRFNAPLADINSFLKRISQRNAKLARILRLLSTTQSSSFFSVVHDQMYLFGGRGGPNTHFICRFESRPTVVFLFGN